MHFKPNGYKLYRPHDMIGPEFSKYVSETLLLLFVFGRTNKVTATMYDQINTSVRVLTHCMNDVTIISVDSYCISLYC